MSINIPLITSVLAASCNSDVTCCCSVTILGGGRDGLLSPIISWVKSSFESERAIFSINAMNKLNLYPRQR
jgi:hypothetical protein